MYDEIPELAEHGYVVLDRCDLDIPAHEYLEPRVPDWKSGGDTNFAPIASAYGAIECAGVLGPRQARQGRRVDDQRRALPHAGRVDHAVGADYGRVRTIKLEPNVMADVDRWIHLDDNNRLNPDGTGRVVRAWLQLTDDPDSSMILRPAKDDRDTRCASRCRRARSSSWTASDCATACTTPARRRATR